MTLYNKRPPGDSPLTNRVCDEFNNQHPAVCTFTATAALTTMVDVPFFNAYQEVFIKAIKVITATDVTANAVNNITITFSKVSADAGTTTVIAQHTTSVVGFDKLVAFDFVNATTTAFAVQAITSGESIQIDLAAAGGGNLPIGSTILIYYDTVRNTLSPQPDADFAERPVNEVTRTS